jgi:hypothetical protein
MGMSATESTMARAFSLEAAAGKTMESATSEITVSEINFSQRTVSKNVLQYADDMAAGKWDWNKSGPIRIMEQDGKWVSYDNRRLMGAQLANLKTAPHEIVKPNDIMPGSKKTWAKAFEDRFGDIRNINNGGTVPRGGLKTQPKIK